MIVVDTGVLFAAADADDEMHEPCAALLASHGRDELVVPIPVVVEAAWMIEGNLGPEAEAAFVETAPDALRLFDLETADWIRAGELVRTYADLALGLVDAAVIAVAERLGITTIATVDHRDFRVVRPRHVDAFELLP